MVRRAWPQQVRPAARGLIATYSDFAVGIAEERDVAVQERDVAVQERDAAVQERDVAVQRELAAQFFASEAQACACGARRQLEQQREKEQRARDWAAAAELRVCLLEQQHLAVQRMADEAERRAREAEEHREAERRMADEAKRRAREAEEHHEAERRMADEEERRVCASLSWDLSWIAAHGGTWQMRHGAVRKKQSGVNAEQRDRVYMTDHVAQRLGSTALQHAGPVTAGRQASGTTAIYHPQTHMWRQLWKLPSSAGCLCFSHHG